MNGKSRVGMAFAFAALVLAVSHAYADELRLKDGSILKGELVYSSDSVIVFKADHVGLVRISPDKLADVPAPAPEPRLRKGADPDPLSQSLFFMPTAFNPAQGSFTFRDFELLFLTFGFSPTSTTTLTAGFFFPISSQFQILSAGFKQQLWRAGDRQTAVALTGNITKPYIDEFDEEPTFYNSNLVVSHRIPGDGFTDAFGFHAAIGYTGVSYKEIDFGFNGDESRTHWADNFSWAAGFEMRTGSHAKFIAEYLSAVPLDVSSSDYGLLSVGIRLHGNRLSADIGGFRPVGNETGDLFLWPMVNIGYRF